MAQQVSAEQHTSPCVTETLQQATDAELLGDLEMKHSSACPAYETQYCRHSQNAACRLQNTAARLWCSLVAHSSHLGHGRQWFRAVGFGAGWKTQISTLPEKPPQT